VRGTTSWRSTVARPVDPTRARRGTGNRPVNTLPAIPDEPPADVAGVDRFPPPPHLPDEAQAIYARVVAELAPQGLRETDAEAIGMLAQSAWVHAEARRELARTGVLVKGPRGPMVNPLVKVIRDEAATYLRLADAYGLTLASRLRLGLLQLAGQSMLDAMNADLDATVTVQVKA